MGSASSRMSASPALVLPTERAPDPPTTSTSPTQSSLAISDEPTINKSTSESDHVSAPPQPLIRAESPVKVDEGKGKQVEPVEDKEEGEISEDEVAIPRATQHNSPLSAKSSSGGKIASYDSYRPTRPQGSTNPRLGPRLAPSSVQQTQYKQPSRSPQQMYFPQHEQHGQNQEHKASLGSGPPRKSPLSPRNISVPTLSHPSLPAKPAFIKNHATGSELPPTARSIESSPPEQSLRLTSVLTPEEAEQYMDIIRNLMSEGIQPDILIKRGATPKYVSKVCREIVEGSRKKVDGPAWTETREPDTVITPEVDAGFPTLPSRQHSPSILRSGLHSPSTGSVDMARDTSISSDGSVETDIKVERMISPEQPVRLIPTSSWTPAIRAPPSPIHVESYRPIRSTIDYSDIVSTQPNYTNAQAGPSFTARLGPRIPVTGVPQLVSSYVPSLPTNPLRSRASELSPVVKRPMIHPDNGRIPKTPPLPGSDTSGQGPKPHIAPTHIPHGSSGVLVSSGDHEVAPLAAAIALPVTIPPSTVPPPVTTAPTALSALLESKRRAMESMKRGRKQSQAASQLPTRPATPPLDSRDITLPILPTESSVAASTQENLEDQVAALEQEVLGLHEAAPKPADDAEEGEIPDDSEPPTIPRMTPIVPSTTPLQLNRSNKRPNAEDMMDNRSSSISSRSQHPAKRRLFGAPLRMKRLLISLDEDDDDSEDEYSAPTPTAAEMETERQRLLQEKDDSIMRLREQILRLQARATRDKKGKAKKSAGTPVPDEVAMPAAVGAEDVQTSGTRLEDRPDTPALPTISLIETSVLPIAPLVETDDAGNQEVATVIADEGNENNMDIDAEASELETAVMRTPQLSSLSTTSSDSANHPTAFSPYRPILDRYPQLASSTIIKSTLSKFSSSPIKSPRDRQFDPARLSPNILTRIMHQDPTAVVCGAESAGGSCADPTCSDIHLSRDLDRPHDEDLIEYLLETSDTSSDIAVIQQGLTKAKQTLGIDHSSRATKGKSKMKNTESNRSGTSYSLAVARQLITAVEKHIQADRTKVT